MTQPASRVITPEPLTRSAFAPFGDVIEWQGRESRFINDATCRRFDDLAQLDVAARGGKPTLSVFEANPLPLPLRIRGLERHPWSSQAFFPLNARRFLVVVAEGTDAPAADRVRAYVSSGQQGVNYKRNTWHHPLLALDHVSHFLVIDRSARDENCEQIALDDAVYIAVA